MYGWVGVFCQVWKYIEQVASGLSHIHKHGVLHLDIKPENIFIDGQGMNFLFAGHPFDIVLVLIFCGSGIF